jgi:hypothetical protein
MHMACTWHAHACVSKQGCWYASAHRKHPCLSPPGPLLHSLLRYDPNIPPIPGVPDDVSWCSPASAPYTGPSITSLGAGVYNVTFTVHWLLAAPAARYAEDAACGEWFFDSCKWRSHSVEAEQQEHLNDTLAAVHGGTVSVPIPASFYKAGKASLFNSTLLVRYNGSDVVGSNVGLDMQPGSSIGRSTHFTPKAQIFRWGLQCMVCRVDLHDTVLTRA